jgi:hypothetical protein
VGVSGRAKNNNQTITKMSLPGDAYLLGVMGEFWQKLPITAIQRKPPRQQSTLDTSYKRWDEHTVKTE